MLSKDTCPACWILVDLVGMIIFYFDPTYLCRQSVFSCWKKNISNRVRNPLPYFRSFVSVTQRPLYSSNFEIRLHSLQNILATKSLIRRDPMISRSRECFSVSNSGIRIPIEGICVVIYCPLFWVRAVYMLLRNFAPASWHQRTRDSRWFE